MPLADLRGFDENVYEPAEDSALLADVAVGEIPGGGLVLDVGTGTGYVATKITERTGARVVGSDLNPHACRRAREEGVSVVRGNLTDPFRAGTFDVVTFNPPYLPLDSNDERSDWLDVALSGGESGRAIIESFLDDVGRVLVPDGFVLLLASTVSDVEAVARYAGRRGFGSVALRDVTYPGETLTILKLVR